MVETPATALSNSLVDAQVVDDQTHKRVRELAAKGKSDPKALSGEDIQTLCATVLDFLDGART